MKLPLISELIHTLLAKGRVPKLKSVKVWSLTIEVWPFSVQIFTILSKKIIVKVRGRGGGQPNMVKDHTFALFKFWDPSLRELD